MLLPGHKLNLFFIYLFSLLILETKAYAGNVHFYEELDPRRPDIKKVLKELDADYESVTGESAHLVIENLLEPLDELVPRCYRNSCKIWADIDKSTQRFYLYVDGILSYTWKTSTGAEGFETPDIDARPDGRIYKRYTSTKYKEGDYNGLGNMPFAVFIYGGFAIHGTIRASWWRLGTAASHGCIRLHPDNGEILNVLVRRNGVQNTWVSVR